MAHAFSPSTEKADGGDQFGLQSETLMKEKDIDRERRKKEEKETTSGSCSLISKLLCTLTHTNTQTKSLAHL